MAEISFSGSYQNPVVIDVPGLLSFSTPSLHRIVWGEDLTFTFPTPGTGIVTLIIRNAVDDVGAPQFLEEQEVSSDDDNVTFLIAGTTLREKLQPGLWHYALLFEKSNGSHRELAQGIFNLAQGVVSELIPG